MLFVFFAIIELAVVNFLNNWRKLRIATLKKKEEEHKKYIENLRSQFTEEKNDFANYMHRGVSLIVDDEPSILRPFGKYKPKPLDPPYENDSPPSTNSYNVTNVNELNRERNHDQPPQPPPKPTNFANYDQQLIKAPEVSDYALLVDRAARVFYPIAFAVFNAVYWPILLSHQF